MDHRAVPLEVLREFARDESERTSFRQVAAAIGLGRTTLQKFIGGETTPHPRVRRQIALWYLAHHAPQGPAPAPDAWSGHRAALQLLVAGMPADERERAVAELLEAIEQVVAKSGLAVPHWVRELRAAERGGEVPGATRPAASG